MSIRNIFQKIKTTFFFACKAETVFQKNVSKPAYKKKKSKISLKLLTYRFTALATASGKSCKIALFFVQKRE